MAHNHRSRTRVNVGKFTALVRSGDTEIHAEVRNISLKGILFVSCKELSEGDECSVRLELADDAVIEARGTVVRKDECDTAVDFTSVEPEGFNHLRRLVQFHSDNPDVIDDEISVPAFKQD